MKGMLTLAILGGLMTGPAFADCTAPADSPDIPSGATATRQQMIDAQKAVKAYDSAVKTYGDCLQQELDARVAAGEDKTKVAQDTADNAKRNNEQVDKLQKVADKFNVELRAFKAKNSG